MHGRIENLAKELEVTLSAAGQAGVVLQRSTPLYPLSSHKHFEVCPHGRPIVKRIRLSDLLREFGRI